MKSQVGSQYAMATRKSARPRISEASLDMWHRRMAHIHPDTVKKAAEMVDGVKIKDSEGHQEPQTPCATCNLAHAPKQISRRGIGRTFGRFGQIYYDLINMSPAYNQHRWITHFYISGIRFHWAMTHEYKDECRTAINRFLNLCLKLWKINIIGMHSDNER